MEPKYRSHLREGFGCFGGVFRCMVYVIYGGLLNLTFMSSNRDSSVGLFTSDLVILLALVLWYVKFCVVVLHTSLVFVQGRPGSEALRHGDLGRPLILPCQVSAERSPLIGNCHRTHYKG